MRCLALAQGWHERGGDALFAFTSSISALEHRIHSDRLEFVQLKSTPGSSDDATQTIEQARARQISWIVADGYRFDAPWQRQIKEAGLKLLIVDDYGHAKHYSADFVLNQNLGASSVLYANREAHTRLLLGTRYVLLRHEFLKWRDWRRTTEERARRILVTLGGSDADNTILKVLQAVSRLKECKIKVVIGGNNPSSDALQATVRDETSGVQLIYNAINMPELMAEADIGIAAGGLTAWELAFMGLPSLLLSLSDNQISNVEHLNALGAARSLGCSTGVQMQAAIQALLDDPEARAEMSRRGQALVDGEGSVRVWLHLNETTLLLRRVTDDDCRLVWQWANDPMVREVSFSDEPISWKNHVRWFSARQQDPHCYFWIACDRDGHPVGQVRFEARSDPVTISVSLDAKHHGRSLGVLLIWLASQKLFCETAIDGINAYIKPDNERSVRAFSKAGFQRAGLTEVNGHPALVFQLSKKMHEIA
jgi:UDP-2,4-diacetamido-2,4,6-trideoxy-beta-L-altropyranose hydrolase